MSGILGRIATWLFVRQIQIEAKKGLTRINADRVRTAIIQRIFERFNKAKVNTPKFTADEDFWQFCAWVMDGNSEHHRLQVFVDGIKENGK